jgi:hypothetical protein
LRDLLTSLEQQKQQCTRWYFYPARFTANNKERAAVKRRVIYETAKRAIIQPGHKNKLNFLFIFV